MLETFSDHEKQLSLTGAAMVEIPKFKPDNKTTAWVDEVIETTATVRSDYLEKDAELKNARAQLHAAWNTGHQAAIGVYPIMQSIYRNDAVASQAVSKLPVGDRTPAETLTRLESMSKQWAELPNMPGTNKTFVAGETDKTTFDGLATALKEKIVALSTCEMQFKGRASALNKQDELNASFIAAALKQGRGQFPEGTQERRLIEAIAAPVSAATATTDEAGGSTNANPDAVVTVFAAGSASAGSPTVSAPTSVNFVTPPIAVNQ